MVRFECQFRFIFANTSVQRPDPSKNNQRFSDNVIELRKVEKIANLNWVICALEVSGESILASDAGTNWKEEEFIPKNEEDN